MIKKQLLTIIFKFFQWVQRSGISYERITEFLIGSSVLLAMIFGYFLHENFYFITLIQALYLIQSGLINDCLIRNTLEKIGFLDEEFLIKIETFKK